MEAEVSKNFLVLGRKSPPEVYSEVIFHVPRVRCQFVVQVIPT